MHEIRSTESEAAINGLNYVLAYGGLKKFAGFETKNVRTCYNIS